MTAILVAALLAASSAPQPSPPTMDKLGLSWKRPPSLMDMARFYPPGARDAGHPRGTATVHCTPDAKGRLKCQAVEQWPEPWKFGRSAVAVMEKATVASTAGSPAGKTFKFTLRFGDWSELARARQAPPTPGLDWDAPPLLHVDDLRGLADGRYVAMADCVSAADGSLSCTAESESTAFARAVVKSLRGARVRSTDGGPVGDRRFRYRSGVIRD